MTLIATNNNTESWLRPAFFLALITMSTAQLRTHFIFTTNNEIDGANEIIPNTENEIDGATVYRECSFSALDSHLSRSLSFRFYYFEFFIIISKYLIRDIDIYENEIL